MEVLGYEVPIAGIEFGLRRLWEADAASTKASLINFAVYSEQPGALVRNTALIGGITREHACRAILIGATLDAPHSAARAWITAHCNLTGGRKALCSEQISFQLDGKAIGRIRNIVFAHLESDLPLVLWWQGPFSRIFEPRFYGIIDRLFLDSTEWPEPSKDLATLRDAMAAPTPPRLVHDLAWARSYQFRVAVASLFEDPLPLAELGRIERVGIRHAPGERMTALLVAAWLSVRLGWSLAHQPEADRWMFDHPRGLVEIALTEAGTSALSAVELQSARGVFAVRREPGAGHLLRGTEEVDGHRSEFLLPADPDTLVDQISSQLARGGDNTLYTAILPAFSALLCGA